MKFFYQLLILNFLVAPLVGATTILVGPNKTVKDLSKIADGNEYVLDYGTYKFPGNITIRNSLILRSANPTSQATIQFPSQWGQLPTGVPDEGSPKSESINCYGSCTMKDMKTSGGEGIVVFTTNPGSTLLVQHVDLLDGGGILRGAGGKSVNLINVQSAGRPTAYFIANFTNPVAEFLIDFTANTMPVRQGGHAGSGKPTCTNTGSDWCQGEAAIRIMDTTHLVMKGVTVLPWLHDGKTEWKQSVQMRGPSGKFQVSNCHFDSLSVGEMAWQNPAPILNEIDMTNSQVDSSLDAHPGILKIVYNNTKVNGVVLNKTTVYPSYTCPKDTTKGCTFNSK